MANEKTVTLTVSKNGSASWTETYRGERALWKARRVARILRKAGYAVTEVA